MEVKMIYYVDSVNGDDGNCGTQENAPLRSLERVNGLKLQPCNCGKSEGGEPGGKMQAETGNLCGRKSRGNHGICDSQKL